MKTLLRILWTRQLRAGPRFVRQRPGVASSLTFAQAYTYAYPDPLPAGASATAETCDGDLWQVILECRAVSGYRHGVTVRITEDPGDIEICAVYLKVWREGIDMTLKSFNPAERLANGTRLDSVRGRTTAAAARKAMKAMKGEKKKVLKKDGRC